MATGDYRSFSRLGMGLDEARAEEEKRKGLNKQVQNLAGLSRVARRGYKDAMRSGNEMAAFEIFSKAKNEGLDISGGATNKATLYKVAEERWNKKQQEMGNLEGRGASTQSGPKPMDFAGDDARARQKAIDASGPQPLSARAQFGADLERSALIQSGDPAARERAYLRGESLGVDREKVRGFLESKIDGYSGGTDLDNDRAREDEAHLASNPTRIESDLIGRSLSGMQNQTAYNSLNPNSPKVGGSRLLLEMAGKMGLKGQGAADWISSMRDKGKAETNKSVLNAQINSFDANSLDGFMDRKIEKDRMAQLRERVDQLTSSSLAKFGKPKSSEKYKQAAGLDWLVSRY